MPPHLSPASNARASALPLRRAVIAGCTGILMLAHSGAQDGKLPPLPSAKNLSKQEREAAAAVQTPEVPQIAPLTPEPERPAMAPVPTPLPPLPGANAFPPAPTQAPAAAMGSIPPPPPTLGVAPSAPLSNPASKNANSTSPSGQFIIHGGDLTLRTAISFRCEEAAEDLRRLLRDTEPWALPVVVLLRVPPDINPQLPVVSTNIAQIAGGGFHLQITVQFRPDFRPADLQMELLRVLIAERILRNHNELATNRTRILPDWLLTGIKEAMEFRHRSRPSAVFAAIFKSGKIYGIEEILDTEPGQLDGLSRTIYDTSCCALVLALIDQPDGPLRFRQFLSSLAVDEKPDGELLRKSFPGLALTGSSLNKWWSLQMASLATPSVFETLGPAETSQALAEALMLRFEVPPDQVPKPHTPVLAAASETKTASHSASKHGEDAKPAAEPAPTEEPTSEDAEKKRGFLSRMFGGGGKDGAEESDRKSKDEPAAEESSKSKPKEKEKEKAEPPPPAPEPEAKTEPKSRKRDKEKAREEEAPPPAEEPKTKKSKDKAPEKAEEAPKSDSKEEDASRKGSGLNPLNWFRGGKGKENDKDSGEKKDQAAISDHPGSATALSPVDWTRAWIAASAAVTSAWNDVAPDWLANGGLSGYPVFLGLGKKKKDGEPDGDAGTQDAEKEDAKAKTKAKDEKKEAPEPEKAKKKSSKDESDAAKPAAKEAEEAKPQEKKESHWFRRERKPGEAADSPPPVETPEPEPKKSRPATPKEKPEKTGPPAPEKETASSAQPLPLPMPLPTPDPASPPAVAPASTTTTTASEQSAAASKGLVAVALPIEDYAQVLKRKDKTEILQRTAQALTALNLRAHVLFRPVINEYIAVIADLTEGKTKGIDQRLQTIRRHAEAAEAQSKAVRDYVDYFQASESNEYSGTFDDYLKLPQQIERELPPRTDPISKYLDALDKEFSK